MLSYEKRSDKYSFTHCVSSANLLHIHVLINHMKLQSNFYFQLFSTAPPPTLHQYFKYAILLYVLQKHVYLISNVSHNTMTKFFFNTYPPIYCNFFLHKIHNFQSEKYTGSGRNNGWFTTCYSRILPQFEYRFPIHR